MKSLLISVVASFLVIGAGKAQQLNDVVVPTQAFDTVSTNYTFSTFTNATHGQLANWTASHAVYHTVQFYPTGACSFTVDRTIDGTNWVAGTSNAVAAASITEVTLTGKYNQLRVRVQGTNVGGGFSYLGGR